MQCPECKSKMKSQKTELHLYKNGETVVIENVSAMICQKCGEEWLQSDIAEKVDQLLEKSKQPKHYSLTPIFGFSS